MPAASSSSPIHSGTSTPPTPDHDHPHHTLSTHLLQRRLQDLHDDPTWTPVHVRASGTGGFSDSEIISSTSPIPPRSTARSGGMKPRPMAMAERNRSWSASTLSHLNPSAPAIHSPLVPEGDAQVTRGEERHTYVSRMRRKWFGIFGSKTNLKPGEGSWWTLVLENKGSVARDHLANERTYLAWLRTSLSLITVGVGVAQLFRLNTNQQSTNASDLASIETSIRFGRALGGTLVSLGIVFLILGIVRYFESQQMMTQGKYPATRGVVTLATAGVLVVMLALIVAVATSS